MNDTKQIGLVRVPLGEPCLRCQSSNTYGARWFDADGALIRQVATGCSTCGWSSSRYAEAHPYSSAVAPDPDEREPGDPGAVPMLRYLAATGLEIDIAVVELSADYALGVAHDQDRDVAEARFGYWAQLVGARRLCHDLYAALDRLREIDPGAADDVADSMRLAGEYDLHGEAFFGWASSMGLDAGMIATHARDAVLAHPPALGRVLADLVRLRGKHPSGHLPDAASTPAADDDPATLAAIDTIARHALATHDGYVDMGERWEDYPELGDGDWSRVCAAAAALREDLIPEHDRYDAAYALLAARADKEA